jgi:integrase/recombinase XerD
MAIKVGIYFDTRDGKRKKTNDFPFKLRVYDGKPRLYHTVYGLSIEDNAKLDDFASHKVKRLPNELQVIRDKLALIGRSAQAVIDKMDPFSFDDFENEFLKDNPDFDQNRLRFKVALPADVPFDFIPYHKKFPTLLVEPDAGTIGQVFKLVIQDKLFMGKVSTALSYQATYTSLVKFGGNQPFKKVVPKYLFMYGEWMKDLGNSKTSTGIYMRNLRAVFNEADALKIIKKDHCYPFGKKKYRIPGTNNTKKAYDISDMQALYHYQCEPDQPWVQKGKDLALFILFGNGLNPLDICRLRRKDMKGDLIEFERGKTMETSKEDPPKITIALNDDLRQIINRQRRRNDNGEAIEDPGSYLFPFFQQDMTPLQEYERKVLVIEFINKWLTYIFKQVGVQKEGRCYDLRHTYATLQIMGGATVNEVQEALGQQDPRTTKRYIDSLPIEQKRKALLRMDVIKGFLPPQVQDHRKIS